MVLLLPHRSDYRIIVAQLFHSRAMWVTTLTTSPVRSLQAVGWVVGFVMGDFTYTLMGWAAGMVISIVVSIRSTFADGVLSFLLLSATCDALM